jgi:hypothetical protein
MPYKVSLKYVLSSILILSLLSCNPAPIPESEARKLAYSALQEYSTKGSMDSINIKEFGEPKKVGYNEEAEVWEIYYESETKLKHRVNILVDDFRNVETHGSTEVTPSSEAEVSASRSICAAALPEDLKTKVGTAYAGWKVLELSDLGAYDQMLWTGALEDSCPGVAVGEFRQPGQKSYGITLIRGSGLSLEQKLLFAAAANDSYNLVELYSETIKGGGYAVVLKGAPGQYQDFYEEVEPVAVKNDTIVYEHMEASAITFYANGDKFEQILVSD